MPARWFVALGATEPSRTLVYFHGGGFVVCSPKTHAELMARLAVLADARVLAVDYRRAPEHRFPAAHDDVLDAVRWLYAQGVDPARVALGGDSAGGNLVAATLCSLRDAGDPLPAAAVLFCPWVDPLAAGGSMDTNADVDFGDRELLVAWAHDYLPPGVAARSAGVPDRRETRRLAAAVDPGGRRRGAARSGHRVCGASARGGRGRFTRSRARHVPRLADRGIAAARRRALARIRRPLAHKTRNRALTWGRSWRRVALVDFRNVPKSTIRVCSARAWRRIPWPCKVRPFRSAIPSFHGIDPTSARRSRALRRSVPVDPPPPARRAGERDADRIVAALALRGLRAAAARRALRRAPPRRELPAASRRGLGRRVRVHAPAGPAQAHAAAQARLEGVHAARGRGLASRVPGDRRRAPRRARSSAAAST